MTSTQEHGDGGNSDDARAGHHARPALTGTHTGEDGRPVVWLVADGGLAVGSYEFVFAVGAYFAALGADLPEPPFLDRVAVRFGIADPEAQYHVPLLVSPWAYSTYRGG